MRRSPVRCSFVLLALAPAAGAGTVAAAGASGPATATGPAAASAASAQAASTAKPAAGTDEDHRAGDLPPPGKIRDLDYGDVLFHFFQDDYFDALVRLEVSRELERLPDHAADAELLSGGLYLSLGLHTEATRIFERLIAGPVPQSVSDRAQFYLARIGYQRGYLDAAERSLARIRGPLPRELESERRLLAANVLMEQGRYTEAAAALEGWADASVWARYARFNLGVALVRAGDAARGRQWLEAVGTIVPRDDEERALRDRANLALGFSLIEQHEADAAVAALNRVRLDGPFTNRALLALGWAEADAERPDRALVPWLELRDRRVLDAAVQESFLAVPYAYARLASTGQAADQYRHAVAAYAAETQRLDESIAAIRGGGFLDSILAASPAGEGPGWLWQLRAAPEAPHTRYLYHLLATHEFQEGLRNYRDLRIMQANLERWAESLEAFDEMVAAREAATAAREPRKAEMLERLDLDALGERQAALELRFADVTARRDVVALATPEQTAQWRKLEEVLARIATLPEGGNRDALAERVRLLRGTLAWSLDADYKLRAWRLKSSLHETASALAETKRRREQVEQAGALAPQNTAGFAARVDELDGRVARLQPRLEAAAAAQERVLAAVAVRELEAQKKRLANYATQAQFALAALYDGAASGAAATADASGGAR